MNLTCKLCPRFGVSLHTPPHSAKWCFGAAAATILIAATAAGAENLRRTAIVDVVERVKGAVVNIHSERSARAPANSELFSLAPSEHRINGMGTGVIIDSRGYIVTNQHVVEDVNLLRVRLNDGSTFDAAVVARDHEADLALLKIEAGKPLPTMPLGTAKDLMVGETVIAIGNAYGYEHTVTVGVVSAVKRDVTLNKEVSYKALIQTDASINPGNSGGPLVNINGEMVGINVAIRAGAQGISFAIPVDTMIHAVTEMVSVRKRSGIWHGLICRNRVRPESGPFKLLSNHKSPKPEAEAKGEPPTLKRELVVEQVEQGSPAAVAGLRPGDVIVKLADFSVASSLDLECALLDHSAGEHVPLVVRRKDNEERIDLILQSLERAEPTAAELVWRKLGLRLQPVNGEVVLRASQQLRGGLAVVEVSPRSAADRAGIQRGDILVGLHQWETLSDENVSFVLNHPDLANFQPLGFYIIRSGQVRRGWFQQID
jgi:serine protease Do